MWNKFVWVFVIAVGAYSQSNVFLDHGGLKYHAEVFYSVANLVVTKILATQTNIKFTVDYSFANSTGLIPFWQKYWNSSVLGSSGHTYEFRKMLSFLPKCKLTQNSSFDLVVFVTQVRNFTTVDCLRKYENNSKFLMIVHHPERTDPLSQLVPWTNTYVASDNNYIMMVTPRHFSPSIMPLPHGIPNCNKNPIFIVQGELSPDRRVIEELSSYLQMSEEYKFIVRILTKTKNSNLTDPHNRIEYHQSLPMVDYHENFLDASFLLPLISPDVDGTRHYFQGHPTSSIAYAAHFHLRVIGHKAIFHSYHHELRDNIGYQHNGTKQSAQFAAVKALNDFYKWCQIRSDKNVW